MLTGRLTFATQVVNAVAGATNIKFRAIDGTGSIEVRQWLELKEGNESVTSLLWVLVALAEGDYADTASTHMLNDCADGMKWNRTGWSRRSGVGGEQGATE